MQSEQILWPLVTKNHVLHRSYGCGLDKLERRYGKDAINTLGYDDWVIALFIQAGSTEQDDDSGDFLCKVAQELGLAEI